MMKNFKNILILVLLISLIGSVFLRNTDNTADNNTLALDNLSNKIETTYVHTIDTIYKLEQKKAQLDDTYIASVNTLHITRNDTNSLKKSFDSVYVPKVNDSTTSVGYFQIYSTLLTNSKFVRDSCKLQYAEIQLDKCNTALDEVVGTSRLIVDTAKTLAKINYDEGYKEGNKNTIKYTIYGTGIGVGLGILIRSLFR